MPTSMLKFLEKPNFVLLACQPKTASTFLTNALGSLPDSRTVRLMPGYDRREQELCETRLRKYRFRMIRNYVSQAHVRNSAPTQTLIDRYGIKTVVLTRDLSDAVASIRDHIRRESVVWPMAWFDDRHTAMDDEELATAIARLMLPWYLNFYFSWKDVPGVLRVSYDDIALEPVPTIQRIALHCGIDATRAQIEASIGTARSAGSRFNKGKTGRGDELPESTKRVIRDILDTYPGSRDDPYFQRTFAT